MNRYIIFFVIIAVATSAYGLLLNKEEFDSVFAARVFFTACFTTLLYFVVVRRSRKK